MKVLIIGGTGVLSRAIATVCVEQGHEVTIITNGLGTLPEPIGIKQHLIVDRDNNVSFISAIQNNQTKSWDLVVDAICYHPSQAKSCLEALQNKSQHIIVISTAVLYTPNATMPISESAPLCEDLSLGKYVRDKIAMEKVWLEAWKSKHYPITILRPPQIIGEGSFLGLIPMHNRDPFIVSRLLKHKPLILADSGKQLIQVVFNRDIAKVILVATGKSKTFGKIYNCANPEIISGVSYFESIAKILGVPLFIKSIPSSIIEQTGWGWNATTISRILDMSNLQGDVGISPSTPYQVALQETINYLPNLSVSPHFDYNDEMDTIEKSIEEGYTKLCKIVSEISVQRERLPIDKRMNLLS
jgi:nucleoside-diphosphate-sugar epimerase